MVSSLDSSKIYLTILFGLCLISSEVFGKSFKESEAATILDDDSDEDEDGKWKQENQTLIRLDSLRNPEVEWDINEDHNGKSLTFGLWDNSSNFRLAVHLKGCNFEDNESINLTSKTTESTSWSCSKKETLSPYFYSTNGIHTSAASEARSKIVSIQAALDNLSQVVITPMFKVSSKNSKVKASLIISIYRDIPGENNCPSDLYNCYAPTCPSKCCSDQSSPNNGQRQHSTSSIPLSFSRLLGSRSSSTSRCIPKRLLCNGQPNCGSIENSDEKEEVCYPDTYCPCVSVCLTWNYVLTSLAIAVLFIITPTAIVFALFHRRNVALERARLLRLAQARVTDMRGDFTSDPPPNDHPPTYDEVYDIKEPPPCFCQAVHTLPQTDRQQRSSEDPEGGAENGDIPEVIVTNDNSSEEGSIGVQNAGFQCSCNSVATSEERSDLPPSYGDVKTRSNGSSRRSSNISSEDPPDYR